MTVEPFPRDQSVRFFGASEASMVYTPPRNTGDPRARACANHRVACDCREAEWAEYLSENRLAWRELQEAAREILRGHATRTYRDGAAPCQCTGCQIARAAHIYP